MKGFYYTQQAEPERHGYVQLTSPEKSSTVVVLVRIGGEPDRVSVACRLIPELVPIAREAQKTCVNPQFWHDGAHEERKDGQWYFGGEAVGVK